jgi:predicted Zn-dependent peptidase
MRRNAAWVGLLVGLAAARGAAAQKGGHGSATSVSAVTSSALSVNKAMLRSGLRVLMNVDHTSPTVVSCLVIAVGTHHDPPGATGLAALAHRVAHAGVPTADGMEVSQVLAARGGQQSSAVGTDSTHFCVSVPSRELPVALWAHARRLNTRAPPPKALKRHARLLRSESQHLLAEQPYQAAQARVQELAFLGYAPYQYAPPIAATLLSRRALPHLASFLARYYVPRNAVLAVVGDFDPDRAMPLAEKHFAARRSSRRAALQETFGALPRRTSPRYGMFHSKQAPDIGMFFGWVLPRTGQRQRGALELAAAILGSGETSRLSRDLVRRRGWAREVTARVEPFKGPGLLTFRILAGSRADPKQVEKVVEQHVTGLAYRDPSPDELDKARTKLQAEWLRELDGPLNRARLIGEREAIFGDAELLGQRYSLHASITPSEVRNAVSTLMKPWQRVVVEVYPPHAPVPPSAVPMKRFHIVRSGDTLIGIARRYGTSVADLANRNKVNPKSPIFPGQKLEVPRGPAAKKKTPKPKIYTVRKGDSLIAIAKRHKVRVSDLTRANGISKKKPIVVGQKLLIPPQ